MTETFRAIFAGMAWLVLIVGAASRPALAQELAGQSNRDCDETMGGGSALDPSPPQVEPSPEEPARPPQEPVHPVPPPPRAAEPSLAVLWPLEYVLRPQTLPAGAIEVGTMASAFRPQSGQLTTADGTPYTFHSTLSLGLWVRTGLTERLEVGLSVPRVLCVARAEPSGCSDINRHNGTGPGLAYGLVRGRALQLKLFAGLLIARSSMPLTWAWDAGGRAKILLGSFMTVEMALALSRRISPGASEPKNATLGSSVFELNLQAMRQLNIFVGLNPYAPVDHLDESALELWGGASWTFRNLSEFIASAGSNNVLAKRAWNDRVPGTFYTLSLMFWF